MKEEIQEIIKEYGLDKPATMATLESHIRLVERETAANIIFMLSKKGKTKGSISSDSPTFIDAIKKLRDEAYKVLGRGKDVSEN